MDQEAVIFAAEHFSIYGIGYKNQIPAFTDVNNHWAKDNMLFVVSRGLLSGTSATTFSPNTGMTRGMFVTALGRLAGVDPTDYQASRFTDVKEDAYYAPYVNWAAKTGVVRYCFRPGYQHQPRADGGHYEELRCQTGLHHPENSGSCEFCG